MGTKRYAAAWYVDEAQLEGVLRWSSRPGWLREVTITPRGWAALSLEPIIPFKKRMTQKTVKDKMVEKVVGEVLAHIERNRNLPENQEEA